MRRRPHTERPQSRWIDLLLHGSGCCSWSGFDIMGRTRGAVTADLVSSEIDPPHSASARASDRVFAELPLASRLGGWLFGAASGRFDPKWSGARHENPRLVPGAYFTNGSIRNTLTAHSTARHLLYSPPSFGTSARRGAVS